MDIGMVLLAQADREKMLSCFRRLEDGPWSTLAVGAAGGQLTTLSVAAGVTENLRLLTNITVLPLHPPVLLASQLATLDVLSTGRFTLGAGVGHTVTDYLGAERTMAKRHQRIDDMVKVMRSVWAGTPPFPDESSEPVGPAPFTPGGPKIVASSQGARSMARAARWADGYTSFTGVMTDLSDDVKRVREAWADAGRVTEPYLYTAAFVALGAPAPRGPFPALTTTDEVKEMIESVESAGYHELLFCNANTDLSYWDSLEAIIADR
jgi:hypothetical protein